MKYKVKKLVCILLIISLISALCPFDISKTTKASDTTRLGYFEYHDHIFAVDYSQSDDQISFRVQVSLMSASNTELIFPGIDTLKAEYASLFPNWSSTRQTLVAHLNDVTGESVQSVKFEKGYRQISGYAVNQFPNATSLTIEKTDGLLLLDTNCFSNISLNEIKINADALSLSGLCFAANNNIQTIDLNANSIKIMGGSNFSSCSKLKNIKLSAENIYLSGGLNFYNCEVLEDITFDGNTTIESTADFSNLPKATITFNKSLTTSGSVFTTSNYKIILKGQENNLGSGFINGGSVEELIISGHYEPNVYDDAINSRTIFSEGAIDNQSTVSSFEISSPVTFANKTIKSSKITDLKIAVDNRNSCKNITYNADTDRLGYNSSVTNLIFTDNDNCKELNNFPLGGAVGDDPSSSLNFENIYFKNKNFKFIGNSTYGRSDTKGTTHVYGYGGGKAWDTNKNIITAYMMYTAWCENSNCEFTNYDSLVTPITDIKLYLEDGNGSPSLTYDSKLVVKISHLNSDGTDPNNSPNNIYFTGSEFGISRPSDNYHILEPTDNQVNPKEQFVYTYYDPVTETTKNYVISPSATKSFNKVDKYPLLLEACGQIYPFHVIVGESSIQSITSVSPVSEHSWDLNCGETVTKDMVRVNVLYNNDKTGFAAPSEYSITMPQGGIKEGLNTCTVVLENQKGQKTFVVTGYPDEVTGFDVTCNKAAADGTITLNEGSVLKTSDQNTAAAILTLNNVTYVNPHKTPQPITKGFKFIVGNQELDTYKISVGQNDVTIRYKSFEKTITILGIQSDIKSISAEYTGNGAYEGFTEIPLSDVQVTITRENNTTEVVKDTALYCIESDYIIKRNENNYLTVTYMGTSNSKKLTAQICVKGLPNTVKELTNVVYEGSDFVGTKVNLNDFSFSIIMDSGEVINSSTTKAIKSNLTFKETDEIELHEGNNFFRIYYEDTANNKFVSSKFTIIGVSNETTPNTNPDDDPERDPTTVTVTETPNTSGHTETSVPNATPTATPLAVSKGKTYNVKNIKYKVLSFNGKTGSVTATGYSKSSKSITITNSIYIKGYKFKVTSISNNAFKNCSALKGTVKFNGSISKIGNNAFIGCKKIKKIVIGPKITSVGSKAFYGCSSLSFVDLRQAKTLKKFGASAFKKNKKGRSFKVKPSTKQYFIYLLKGKY